MLARGALAVLLAHAAPASAEDDERVRAAALAMETLQRAEGLLAGGTEVQLTASLIAFEQASDHASVARDGRVFVRARLGKARALLRLGRWDEAEPALAEATGVAREAGHPDLLIATLGELADAHAERSCARDALLALREIAALHDEAARPLESGLAWLRAFDVALSCGEAERGEPLLAEALASFERAGDPGQVVEVLLRRALLLRRLGRVADALREARAARSAAEETADPERQARALLLESDAERSLGRLEPALLAVRRAEDACREAADPACEAAAHERLATLFLRVAQPRPAADRALRALTLYRLTRDSAGEGRSHLALGMALRRLERDEPALAALDEAAAFLGDEAEPPWLALVHAERARALAELGHGRDAALAYDRALDLLVVAGATGELDPPSGATVDRETLLAEILTLLADDGLWARSLELALAHRGARALTHAHGDRPEEAVAVDLDALRDLTRAEDAPLVVHHPLEDAVLAWVLTPDGRLAGHAVHGAGREHLADLAAGLRDVTPGQAQRAAANPDEPLGRTLRRGWDLLLATAVDLVGDPPPAMLLTVAPAADLRVPLDLLIGDDGEPLGRRTLVVEVSPQARPARPAGRTGLLLVDRPAATASAAARAVREVLDDGAPAPTPALPAELRGLPAWGVLPALPHARFATGGAAAEEAVRRLGAEADTWLVLAPCAGSDEAEGAALLLWPTGGGPGGDGRLTAQEVAALPLRGAAIVLLSCRGPAAAELSDAFLEAGARGVVTARAELVEGELSEAAAGFARELARGASVGDATTTVRHHLEGRLEAAWGTFRVAGSLP